MGEADPTIPDGRNCSPLMAAFKKGHVKVVKHLVKKVTQFPSDQECYNYIQSIKEKDPELRMRCAQCVEIIITAKERQEKEANKHTDSLLKLIDEERNTKLRVAKKREKKKEKAREKRKEAKESKKKTSPAESVDNLSQNGTSKSFDDDDDKENFSNQTESPDSVITATVIDDSSSSTST